jgi:hypothetical protein
VRRLLEAVRRGEELDATDRITAGAWLDNFDEVFPLAEGIEGWERPKAPRSRFVRIFEATIVIVPAAFAAAMVACYVLQEFFGFQISP